MPCPLVNCHQLSSIIAACTAGLYLDVLNDPWGQARFYDFLHFVHYSLLSSQHYSRFLAINTYYCFAKYIKTLYEKHGRSALYNLETERVIFYTSLRVVQKFINDDYVSSIQELEMNTYFGIHYLRQFEFRFLSVIEYNINLLCEDYLLLELGYDMRYYQVNTKNMSEINDLKEVYDDLVETYIGMNKKSDGSFYDFELPSPAYYPVQFITADDRVVSTEDYKDREMDEKCPIKFN